MEWSRSFNVIPIPKGRPRFSKYGRAYTPTRTQAAEDELKWLMKEAWRRSPLTCPVAVEIVFHLPSKRRQDIDNLGKCVLDAGNGILWADDHLIHRLTLEKRHDGEAKIDLSIETLDNSFINL